MSTFPRPLLLLGCGQVGRALLGLLPKWTEHLQLWGVADTSGLLLTQEPALVRAHKLAGRPLSSLGAGPMALPPTAGLVIDAAVGDNTTLWLEALSYGHAVVTANKVPLSRPAAPWDLWRPAWERRTLGLASTVGAGVPSASCLLRLREEGDTVRSIQAVVSGTLHFVLERVAAGQRFSDAVFDAKDQGYSEPDPTLDLSGADVGRKLTILGHLASLWQRAPMLDVEPLAPPNWRGLSATDLHDALRTLDGSFARRVLAARDAGERLRYVGRASGTGVRCALEPVPAESPLGRLGPSDNGVILHTQRFHATPLGLTGPGFGPETTARALLADARAACNRFSS
ncbi:MAG: hypothetical protein EA397_01140 [Deltaproteobacteria bacterium]|nr:MAG: hypothetical protein EA397_01140 [Deltaproteobacteria bacterium]